MNCEFVVGSAAAVGEAVAADGVDVAAAAAAVVFVVVVVVVVVVVAAVVAAVVVVVVVAAAVAATVTAVALELIVGSVVGNFDKIVLELEYHHPFQLKGCLARSIGNCLRSSCK